MSWPSESGDRAIPRWPARSGIKRAVNAQEAFIRVMRSLPEKERLALHARESARLDLLEVRIRTRDADQPVKMERHLAGLEALRETMR